MSLIFESLRKHIEGYKHLTDNVDVVKLDTINTVYIPLVNGKSTNFDVLVTEGELVKVGSNVGVRNDGLVVPVFSSVSGVVKEIKKMPFAGGGMCDHVVIENDHKYEEEELTGLDYTTASREELVQFTMNKGIVGCGGAGFPAYVKYRGAENIDKVIINAVECEPYITADFKQIDENTKYLMHGALAMKKMAGAKEVIIAIKKDKDYLIEKMQAAITDPSISIATVPNQYPMGYERSLIRFLEKKEYENLPSEIGIISNNSTTAIQLGIALKTGMPIVEKIITVSGNAVKNPMLISARVGTQVKELLDAAGNSDETDVILAAGGPMMGPSMNNSDFVITPYSNAITLLKPEITNPIACLRCGACSDVCPTGLQPVRIREAFRARDFEELKRLQADKCVECGLCSFVCPSKIEVTQDVIIAKRVVAGLNRKK